MAAMILRQRRSIYHGNEEQQHRQNESHCYSPHGSLGVGDLPTHSSSESTTILPQSVLSPSPASFSDCSDSDNNNCCSNAISLNHGNPTAQKELMSKKRGTRYHKISKYNPVRRHNLHVYISLLSISLLLFNHGQSFLLDGNHVAREANNNGHDGNFELQEQEERYQQQHETKYKQRKTFQNQSNSSKSSTDRSKCCATGGDCGSNCIHIPYLNNENQGTGFIKPIEYIRDYDEEDDYYYDVFSKIKNNDDEEDEEDEGDFEENGFEEDDEETEGEDDEETEEEEDDEETEEEDDEEIEEEGNFEEDEDCKEWAQNGECEINPGYMWKACKQSCTKAYHEKLNKRRNNQEERHKPKREPLVYNGKHHFFLEVESKHDLMSKAATKNSQIQAGNESEEEEYVPPQIIHDDYLPYEDDNMRTYFAFDDDNIRHHECRRTSWHRNHKPNCNIFHEIALDFLSIDNSASYLASGGYRDAFRVVDIGMKRLNDGQGSHDNVDDIVMKLGTFSRDYNDDLLEMIRIDAMVMELLSASKRTVDIYGHCGTSVSVAFLEPKDRFNLSTLIETPNALTPSGKLRIALSMAESIAEMHGYEGGPIIHGDIQYVQWLLDKNDNVILSDFNRAEVMLWDEDSQEYCRYFAGGANGNVRSPEEYKEEPVNEMIDVYSFGLVLYTILTGLDAYWDEGIDDVRGQILEGIKPVVDIYIRSNSEAEEIMAAVMDECLNFDVEQRIDIFSVVSLLKDAVQQHGQADSLRSADWEEVKFNISLEEEGEEGEDIGYDNSALGWGDDLPGYYDEHGNDKSEYDAKKNEANKLRDELRL